MRCEEIVIELDAYVTGELEADTQGKIGHHIQQCSACRAELEMLQKENALYQDYRSRVDLPPGAWTEAQARMSRPIAGHSPFAIRHSPSVTRWRLWAAAASILLAIGLSWHFYERRGAPELSGSGAPGPAVESPSPMNQAVKEFEQALALLRVAYMEKKTELDPELVKELDRNLAVTRIAIAECERALKENPDNDQAIEFLLLGYEKQIGILRQITEEL